MSMGFLGKGKSFQNLALPDPSKMYDGGLSGSYLVQLLLPEKGPEVQAAVVQKVSDQGREVFSSVYKYAGNEAQPPGHPGIDGVDGGWLVMVLLVGEEGKVGEIEGKVNEVLKKEGVDGKGSWGVWVGELFMQ